MNLPLKGRVVHCVPVVALTVGLGVIPLAVAAKAVLSRRTGRFAVDYHGDEAASATATGTLEVAFRVPRDVVDLFFTDVHTVPQVTEDPHAQSAIPLRVWR